MPKFKYDNRDEVDDYRPYKEKVPRRKPNHFEEFDRGHDKRNKRNKKRPENGAK